MLFGLRETFGMASAGVGMGIIGSGLDTAGMAGGTGLIEGGAVATSFVSPMVNISAGGSIIGMLRKFNRRL